MTHTKKRSYVPDFEREFLIENAQVIGFCRLTNLMPGRYGKNYQLTVMVDEDIAQEIEDYVKNVFEALELKYGKTPQLFKRVSTRFEDLRQSESKSTGFTFTCPQGKKLLCLNMDTRSHESHGERVVYVYDTDNEPLDDVDIRKDSIVNAEFTLRSYNLMNKVGVSLFLGSAQIVELVKPQRVSPFKKLEKGFKSNKSDFQNLEQPEINIVSSDNDFPIEEDPFNDDNYKRAQEERRKAENEELFEQICDYKLS